MVNTYPYLPAHLVQYKDGGLQLTREEAQEQITTSSILIIGTAVDGPVAEPVKVDSQTYELFGKSVDDNSIPNGATLTTAFEEAYKFGARDIRLMRLSGTPAEAVITGAEKEVSTEKYVDEYLGTVKGNTRAESICRLDEYADDVIEVIANGITLSSDQYETTTIATTYTDTGGNEYTESEVIEAYVWNTLDAAGAPITVYLYQDGSVWREFHTNTQADMVGFEANPAYVDPITTPSESEYIGANPPLNFASTAARTYVAYDSGNSTIVTNLTVNTTNVGAITAIAIKDYVCTAGAYIVLKLKIGSEIVIISGNSLGAFMTGSEPWDYTLTEEPDDIKNVTVYINTVEYSSIDKVVGRAGVKVFELNGKTLTINYGKHAPVRTRIDVRYKNVTTELKAAELIIRTGFGGNIYNESLYTVIKSNYNVNEKLVSIEKPESKKSQVGEEPLIFSSYDYPTYGLLAQAINKHPRNGGLYVAAVDKVYENESVLKLNETSPDGKYFINGDDGIKLSKQELFEKLAGKRDEDGYLIEEGMFQLLENYSVDNVALADGVYADEELNGRWQNFAQELALFCAVCSFRNHQTHGFIATSSPLTSGLKDIRNHVERLANFSNVYIMREQDGTPVLDQEQNEIDLGKFVTVVAGPELVLSSPRIGQYSVNSAAAAAGYISTLPANVFATNKIMAAAGGLKARFSNSQLNTLSGNRYMTYKYKDDGVTVAIVDAPTSAKRGSDYTRLSTVCALRIIINDLRETADPFLGQPNTTQSRNALSAAVDKVLFQHKEAGSMQDYSFVVVATAMDELLGQAQIELTIVPAQELRQLTTIVSLKPAI